METLLGLSMQLSLIMSVVFIAYVVVIVVPYLRRRRRATGEPGAFEWHFFVPCRDEEAVIDGTVTYLRTTFGAHVWVIDDDSDDRTGRIVAAHAEVDPRVHLVQRRRPEARTGKGDALNTAYAQLLDFLGPDADLDKVIVAVVDADGRPAANCLEVCAGDTLFADPEVGAAQIEVRMVNRDEREPTPGAGRLKNFLGRTLVRMQDMEFRTVIAAIQDTRRHTKTVGMGGNGQFTRLSALTSLDSGDGRAWRGSLLEDFELGVHLLLAGWRSEFTADTWVDQEALFDGRRYLTQRTRWGQGVMQCGRYWRAVWSSTTIPNIGMIEMSYYMLQPWLTLLGTIVYPVPLVLLAARLTAHPDQLATFLSQGGLALLLSYLLLGLGPFILWGPIYVLRCETTQPMWRGIGWGLAYVVYVYGFYITTWRAFGRILTGRSGWAKTRRNAETHVIGPIATEA
ncbi:glycosyltransferase [Cellulosimicrobium sp. NPDC057862]|uniref:glycosyltransferase n=1 Tax=Cellulosimicrobium sp. NPDC057862 TaxID=3346266 RepID=UPI00366B2A1A